MQRHIILLTMLVSVAATSYAQLNRWTRASNPGVSSSTKLASSSNGLYLLGTAFHYTATQGASWTPCVGTKGSVVAIFRMDVGITIAAANDADDRVMLFYSQSGLNWEPLDTLPQKGVAIGIGAVGTEFMVALKDGRVFKRTPDAWQQLAATSITNATQFIATPSMLLVASPTSVAISKDKGASWTPVDAKGVSDLRHVRETGGRIYVAYANGVAMLDPTGMTLTPVNVQALEGTTNVEAYVGSVYAMSAEAFGPDSRRRLYRFDAANASWLAMADTLPGRSKAAAGTTAEQSVLDAGRLVYAHVTDDTATSGIYVVDLNVVSNVDASEPGIAPAVGSDVIDTGIPASEGISIVVTDMVGRVIVVPTQCADTVRLQRQHLPAYPVAVTVQSSTGQVSRRLVMP